MSALHEHVEQVEQLAVDTGFSGVVRVDLEGETVLARAFGSAHRALGVSNTVDTAFGLASGSKVHTALAVLSLVEDGLLGLDTTARSLLGADLPLIGDDVTVEHLLAHRSGIGDYLDEEAGGEITDYAMPVPVHTLVDTEDFLAVLDGFPPAFAAGTAFSYCNGGYVVLALIAERASGTPFHDLVRQRVCEPAGLTATAYHRSDELPPEAALGYLWADRPRTNLLHLPVRGTGDGGAYATVADVHALWEALFAGRIVPDRWVAEMVRPRSTSASARAPRYGLGLWLHPTRGGGAALEGYDAGASFRSVRDEAAGLVHTVVSNTSEGAWPLAWALEAALP
jgi:CubicO group peptidase (beta-lactamase class C family)